MKKNLFTTLLALALCCTCGFAQQGEIIYKTYPDEWINHTGWAETFYDINDDSIADICMQHHSGYAGILEGWFHTLDNWDCCSYSTYHYTDYNNYYQDLSLPLNNESLIWGHFFVPIMPRVDTLTYKTNLRLTDGDTYYYGWVSAFEIYDATNNTDSFIVTETCFCTIPNYPLRWGQTSLTEGIGETEAFAFATLHPNPTTGLVTITGKDLKQAEVLNTLGQHVATITGEGETLHIDISHLPAGVYFVNVTDGEGRKCVRKVVKE